MSRDEKRPEEAVLKQARAHADATVAIPSVSIADGQGPASSAPPSMSRAPLYSDQPRADRGPVDPSQIVPSAITIGTILESIRKAASERHDVEARIASGGMGSIDVAIDRALDRRVAVKTLHQHLRSDESAVRMFLREARVTGILDHPHIVPLYEVGERASDGSLFFSMKLVEGRTLAALIGALPRGPIDTATLYTLLDVVTKVCDALAFAHSRGVLHCDVKPANVMVGDYGQVFLMDWGIARLLAGDTSEAPLAREGAIVGTPCYMSPEQARGERSKLDVRADVFLLGAMLYELVTHRAPYAAGDRLDMLERAAAGAFPSPRKVAGAAAVPLELERIILRAMAKDKNARYPTVAALKDDLLGFMRGGVEFPRRSFQTGDVILREGDPGDEAYIVVEGRCSVQRASPTGPQTVQTLGPGDVFGEMAILAQGPRTATVAALVPTTLLVVTSKVLEQEMATLKPWMARILTSLAGRFREADNEQRALPGVVSSPRIANQLLMTLVTWGEDDGHGGRTMRWSAAAAALEAQLGVPADAIVRAIGDCSAELDVSADRIAIRDVIALRERLARGPGPGSSPRE